MRQYNFMDAHNMKKGWIASLANERLTETRQKLKLVAIELKEIKLSFCRKYIIIKNEFNFTCFKFRNYISSIVKRC